VSLKEVWLHSFGSDITTITTAAAAATTIIIWVVFQNCGTKQIQQMPYPLLNPLRKLVIAKVEQAKEVQATGSM
jgi:hypothetical protein